MSRIEQLDREKGVVCTQIMQELRDWFEEEEGITACAKLVEDMPVLVSREAGEVTGMIALKHHAPVAMEVFLVAVRRNHHRRGIGEELIASAEAFSRTGGCRLLTVKTLAPRGKDEPQFEATRRFYEKCGFLPAEIFPTLWHEDHPCLFLVKPLAGGSV